MKIKNFKRHPYKITTLLLAVLVLLLLIVLIGYGYKIRDLDNELNGVGSDTQKQENGLAMFPLKVYIQNALKGFYHEAGVASATDNRVYFPEMKFYLPLNDQTRSLRYLYTSGDKTAHLPAQAQFTTVFFLNRLVDSFNDVPCQQRLTAVGINNKIGTDLTTAGSLKMSDGRTLYFYKNTEPACRQFYQVSVPQQIINLLKEAKPY
ncbi:MAG TPA: hypothetical protein VFP35_04410 [Candidatus Saccharimonadales bacterium]|nr:hypothetical protein [Candidatus Saccharimonadales bacterium]